MKTQSKNNLFLIAFFLASLFIPAVFGLFFSKNTNSLIEKRRLSKLPQAPISIQDTSRWKKAFEKYYQDHFGLRYSYLYLFRHIKYLIGDPAADFALFGKQRGWIFYNRKTDGDIIGDYRNINQFNQQQLNLMIKHLKTKQKWLADQGIEYLFVLAPSKHYIYPEKLPSHISKLDKINLSDQLAKELEKHPSINFVYLKPLLLKAKDKTDQLLYFKADSHWSYYGANIAQYEIAKNIEKLFPKKIHANPNLMQSTQEKNYFGDHSRYMGIERYFQERINIPQLHSCTFKNKPNELNFNKTFTTECLDAGLKALIFRDSFFTNLQPFISGYFKKATYIWSKINLNTAKQWIQQDKPDLVIEEWVDRYLPDSFSPH